MNATALKPIVKLLQANTGAHRMYEVFDDFTAMFAIAHRQVVDKHRWQEREDEYLRIAGKYDRTQLDRFAEAWAHVVTVMDAEPTDVLGRLYMELEISDSSMGQFYTPYEVARLIADMNKGGLIEALESREFVDVYEPACGAGAFLIAITQTLHGEGINFQQRLHVTADDLSRTAVHMCYLHMTLLHVPAVIHRRNTLTMETFDTWVTPAHVLGGWGRKIRSQDAVEMVQGLTESEPPAPIPVGSAWDDVFAEIAS